MTENLIEIKKLKEMVIFRDSKDYHYQHKLCELWTFGKLKLKDKRDSTYTTFFATSFEIFVTMNNLPGTVYINSIAAEKLF